MAHSDNYYEFLGVEPTASQDEIKKLTESLLSSITLIQV